MSRRRSKVGNCFLDIIPVYNWRISSLVKVLCIALTVHIISTYVAYTTLQKRLMSRTQVKPYQKSLEEVGVGKNQALPETIYNEFSERGIIFGEAQFYREIGIDGQEKQVEEPSRLPPRPIHLTRIQRQLRDLP